MPDWSHRGDETLVDVLVRVFVDKLKHMRPDLVDAAKKTARRLGPDAPHASACTGSGIGWLCTDGLRRNLANAGSKHSWSCGENFKKAQFDHDCTHGQASKASQRAKTGSKKSQTSPKKAKAEREFAFCCFKEINELHNGVARCHFHGGASNVRQVIWMN